MYVDIIAHHCTLFDRPKDESTAKFFDLHPEFSVHITERKAEFEDCGHVFFEMHYNYFLRNGDYLHVAAAFSPQKVAINMPEEHVVQDCGTMRPGDDVMCCWRWVSEEENDEDDDDEDDDD